MILLRAPVFGRAARRRQERHRRSAPPARLGCSGRWPQNSRDPAKAHQSPHEQRPDTTPGACEWPAGAPAVAAADRPSREPASGLHNRRIPIEVAPGLPASGIQERWPSGLRRTLGKRVYVKAYRGFESHSLRQIRAETLHPCRCQREAAGKAVRRAVRRPARAGTPGPAQDLVLVNKCLEPAPGKGLQKVVHAGSLRPHGGAPLPCPMKPASSRITEESTPCPVSSRTQPDSREGRPGK